MINYYDSVSSVLPDTARKNAAVFTCAYNEREMRPGKILCCDAAASSLTGFSIQQLLSCTLIDLCHEFPFLNTADLDKNVHFRNEIHTHSGQPLLCDFYLTALYSVNTVVLQIVTQPVSFDISHPLIPETAFPSNKLEILDTLSHGISHGINNAINLVTLSSDLLAELFDELISGFDSSVDVTIRGMSLEDLSKMVHQLTDNLLKSSSKINTVSQALVHFLRGNEPAAVTSYDFRKILQTAVILTEHEINKSAYNFTYEPPQGIIKRTGIQYEILQAIFNCILFLCECASEKSGHFKIFTIITQEQNSFSIVLQHDKAVLPENEDPGAFLKSSVEPDENAHPLSVAKSLIVANSGELEITQTGSVGVNVKITFTTVSFHF